MLLIICAIITLLILIKTPFDKQLNRVKWDKSTTELFKRQLGLSDVNKMTQVTCPETLIESQNYIIVTGFLSTINNTLENHLWLYFNLLSLETVYRSSLPNLRFLLPTESHKVLSRVFENVLIKELGVFVQCHPKLNIDQMVANSIVVGSYLRIFLEDQKSAKSDEMIILNENTKRLVELAELDFSFKPNLPVIRKGWMERARRFLEEKVLGRNRRGEGIADSYVVGVYVGKNDDVSTESIKITSTSIIKFHMRLTKPKKAVNSFCGNINCPS